MDLSWLEREFEESDVFEVVQTLSGDKASGPNGFSLGFFFFSNMLGGS